jgi:hypothetical protein
MTRDTHLVCRVDPLLRDALDRQIHLEAPARAVNRLAQNALGVNHDVGDLRAPALLVREVLQRHEQARCVVARASARDVAGSERVGYDVHACPAASSCSGLCPRPDPPSELGTASGSSTPASLPLSSMEIVSESAVLDDRTVAYPVYN